MELIKNKFLEINSPKNIESKRFPTTISFNSTIFLCFKFNKRLISLKLETGRPSFSAEIDLKNF